MIDYKEILEKTYEIASLNYYVVIDVKGNYMLYSSNEDGVSSLFLMKGDARVKVAERITLTTYIENGKFLYAYEAAKGRELHKVFMYDVNAEKSIEIQHPAMRVLSAAFDGKVGLLTGSAERNSLYVIRGNTAEKVRDLNYPFSAVSSIYGEYAGGMGYRTDGALELFFYNLKTDEFETYSPKVGSSSYPPLITEKGVLFASNFESGKFALYLMDIREKIPKKLHEGYTDYTFYDYREGKVIFVGKERGRSSLHVGEEKVKTPEGVISNAILDSGKVYVTYSNLITPPSIYVYNGEWKKVMGDRTINLGEVEYHSYPSSDGIEIPAFLVKSSTAKLPGPTVVYIHGGPWGEVDDSFDPFITALAINGYHVIAPNFRGSTGYGEQFRMMDIGDAGGKDMEDIANAVKYFKEIITEAFAVGYSYGGFSTLKQLGKFPELWKAGVAGAPVADWVDMYELADAAFKGFIDLLFKGDRKLMSERSPIAYVENVKAPVCIIAGQNDSRTPLRPILRYVEKLMNLGKSFEVHILPDAGHIPETKKDFASILIPTILFLKNNTS
ncbi:acylaminoacyl-peptidase [Sulfolobales archaeon HS-7]|nr:acylaminoacyl-peptidase [Sulfolobales archaeon HS-7]